MTAELCTHSPFINSPVSQPGSSGTKTALEENSHRWQLQRDKRRAEVAQLDLRGSSSGCGSESVGTIARDSCGLVTPFCSPLAGREVAAVMLLSRQRLWESSGDFPEKGLGGGCVRVSALGNSTLTICSASLERRSGTHAWEWGYNGPQYGDSVRRSGRHRDSWAFIKPMSVEY